MLQFSETYNKESRVTKADNTSTLDLHTPVHMCTCTYIHPKHVHICVHAFHIHMKKKEKPKKLLYVV